VRGWKPSSAYQYPTSLDKENPMTSVRPFQAYYAIQMLGSLPRHNHQFLQQPLYDLHNACLNPAIKKGRPIGQSRSRKLTQCFDVLFTGDIRPNK
jgi:hypothetical protein